MTATAVLCAMLAAPAAAPIPKERADAEKVVGLWKLVKSTNYPGGLTIELTIELTQGGKFTIRQSSGGQPPVVYDGEYKVMKNELPYSVKLPNGRGEKAETLTIKKLTETELIVVDPDGIQEDFVRVKKDEKKEAKTDEKK